MAQILSFPDRKAARKKRSCADCKNGALSIYGVYCMLFREDVIDETDAEECEAYEEPYQYG